jgi:serine/threonine-protein kinase RsbW
MLTKVLEELSESYLAVAESIPHARSAITQFALRSGITGEPLEDVRLALTEAATNVVKHAYPELGTGVFYVTAAVAAEELWVLVSDDGCGYRASSQVPGLGWGLTLIAKLSQEYVITERGTGGTEVRMRFPISPDGNTVDS